MAADSMLAARKAAKLANIEYEPLTPVLDVVDGKRAESWVLPPMQMSRGDADTALKQSRHHLKGEINVGGMQPRGFDSRTFRMALNTSSCPNQV